MFTELGKKKDSWELYYAKHARKWFNDNLQISETYVVFHRRYDITMERQKSAMKRSS